MAVASEGGKRRIRDYAWRYRVELALGFAALIITNLLALAIPWLLKLAVDAIGEGGDGSVATARNLALGIIAAALVMCIIRTFSRIWIFGSGRRVEYDIRNDLFLHLSKMSPSWFQKVSVGDVMSRMVNDLAQVRLLLGPGLLNIVNTAVAYSVGISLMAIIDLRLALIALIPYPLLMIWIRVFAGRLFRAYRAVQNKLGDISTDLQENLSGQPVIRCYGRESASIEAFESRNDEYLDLSLKLALTRGMVIPVFGLVGGIGTLVVLWLGGKAVIEGRISLGELVAFNGYLALLAWPTIALGWILSVWQRGRSAMERLNEIFMAMPDVCDEGKTGLNIKGHIEIRDLTYVFEASDSPVLSGISITVPAGSKLGIVGGTGAGKSTLVNLLPRIEAAPPGTILIDDIPIEEIPLSILRGSIGYASQSPFLFSASIHDNIAFARPDASREEVRAAARIAALDEDILSFPMGYDTLVGERGVTLSGGQCQRVALARAILSDPAILILDDSLSSVDAETEARILSGLDEIMAGRTGIIVSHRIAAVMKCDNILVLENGKITAEGTHEELVADGGLYGALWRRQRLEEEIERSVPGMGKSVPLKIQDSVCPESGKARSGGPDGE